MNVLASTPSLQLLGIPTEFILFGVTLLAVAFFHHHTLRIALLGLASIVAYKLIAIGVTSSGGGFAELAGHLGHEWVLLANLFLLLTGFALLSRHFEESGLPEILPRFLPHDWKGCFLMLALVWALSSFLDNIAGALIGGAMARKVFRGQVHIGFLAAIVAASNAGGAWSVVGDTTTTMMWIAGIPAAKVFAAILPATIALFIFGVPAALQQHRLRAIQQHDDDAIVIDWPRVAITVLILLFAIATNVIVSSYFVQNAEAFPFLGVAIWFVILATTFLRAPDWSALPRAIRGAFFLVALVLCAVLMPVSALPIPSWRTTFGLGLISAVFDNIPLTALALKQGGYSWCLLAYAIGFGGSMIWFGSSSGVALANIFPEVRSVGAWLRHGWPIVVAYFVAFFVMLALLPG